MRCDEAFKDVTDRQTNIHQKIEWWKILKDSKNGLQETETNTVIHIPLLKTFEAYVWS